MKEKESCGTCRFHRKPECHRHPPVCEAVYSCFPSVLEGWWCGEYEAADKTPCLTCLNDPLTASTAEPRSECDAGVVRLNKQDHCPLYREGRRITVKNLTQCRTCVSWHTGPPTLSDDEGCCLLVAAVRTQGRLKVANVTVRTGDWTCDHYRVGPQR